MSPRRSSRARTTQPPGTQHTSSASSSTSSSRGDRNTRLNHKASTPQKSVTPGSITPPEVEGSAPAMASEPPQTRRRKREKGEGDEEDDELAPIVNETNMAVKDDEEDEEEITRCVCGQLEYPGPPTILVRDQKSALKEEGDPESSLITSDVPPDESGGLFIQCDDCKVWQHGGCVGIMEETMSPEEYFCEQCRRDLHKISTAPNGQRYSRYLPVLGPLSPGPSRATSHSKDADPKVGKEKGNRAALLAGGKRRSTMNSRDAAYDEDEMVRIAIAKSKAEKAGAQNENGSRKGKRSRSDSTEARNNPAKRQRTSSESSTMAANSQSHSTSQPGESEDENGASKSSGGSISRGAAARTNREKENVEKDKEKERADAAGRRKGRAEKRRGEDSDPSDEYPLARKAPTRGNDFQDLAAPSQLGAGSPPAAISSTATTSSHRKTGRAPTRRGRVGRNQYTKDRDGLNETYGRRDTSARRSQSRDPHGEDGGQVNGASGHQGVNGDLGKPSKPRYMNPHRTTMHEMKRRVAAILEFISHTQVEMAGERTPPTSGGGSTAALLQKLADGLPMIKVDADETSNGNSNGDGSVQKDFAHLSSLEMMDVLTRKLVLWQKEFGKWGEK
ncbi:MAG: hypothetical protein M1833_001677 [Piccolia ochrophora]|nr:MAG: hypothetical protein M1833_001677 [Piccolia ochrophora]